MTIVRMIKKGMFVVWLLCLLLAGSVQIQASDDLEMTILLEDAVGSYMPRATTQNPMLYSSYLSDFSYEEQLENEMQVTIYKQLESISNWLKYSSKEKFILKLPYTVVFEGKVTEANYKNDPAYNRTIRDFAKASHAYLKDHTELYWINGISLSITQEDIANGYFTRFKVYPQDYYEGIRDEINPTNQRIRQFVNTIKQENLYAKICYIHDYVCKLITFPENSAPLYYHTIPCAWLDTYGHMGVCEAYSKSFAYICELSGIEALTIAGGNKRNNAGEVLSTHMWNYVKMDDGNWYLVDCTWDDSENGSVVTSYLLKGSLATSYNHIPIGCFTSDDARSYVPFTYPALASNNYNVVKSITAPADMAIEVDETKAFSVSYLPKDANQGIEFTYEVLDEKVAAVDNKGNVTGKAAGETEVIIRSKKFQTVQTSFQVEVRDHEPDPKTIVVLQKPTCNAEGKAEQTCVNCKKLFTTAIPIDPQAHKIGAWKVIKKATCLKEGASVRKCTYCKIEMDRQVIPKVPAKVTLNLKSLPLQVGKTTTALKIENKDPNDKLSGWKSSDSKIVSVNSSSGKLTGKKAGTATITVTMKSGAKASCKVTVKKTVATKSMKPTVSSVKLKKKQSYKIKVIRNPITAADTLTYSSSNSRVAKVSKTGTITAVRAGTAKITIKSKSGAKTSLKVIVK